MAPPLLTDAPARMPEEQRQGAVPAGLGSSAARRQLFLEMCRRRQAGDSFARIAQALNERGLRGDQGGRWYGASVRNFIRRMQPGAQSRAKS